MAMLKEIGVDANFVVGYFALPVGATAHVSATSKGGLTFYIIKNTERKVWKICRRRWMNNELPTRELESLIAKICRMICHNTGDKTIRNLSGIIFK
jgi:predicted nucleic acid-binding protein